MNTKLFALAALALSLAACTNDNENLNDGPVAAQFTAAIGDNVTATTRVSGTDGTKWDKGDCIATASALPVPVVPRTTTSPM